MNLTNEGEHTPLHKINNKMNNIYNETSKIINYTVILYQLHATPAGVQKECNEGGGKRGGHIY